MKKQYYYSLAFYHSDGKKEKVASVYIGYDFKFISLPQIIGAKESAEIDKNAMMLSCCYLGKMTKEEFETGLTRRFTMNGVVMWIKKATSFWNKFKNTY